MADEPLERLELPTRRLGRPALRYALLASTSDTVRELAASGAAEGLAVLADAQTAGRGRLGRSWLAPPRSSVLVSVLLTPPPAYCRPAVLTAWAAVAVGEAVLALAGVQARVKWPNDLLIAGRKVSGILIEQAGPGAFVAGVGLNVTQSHADFEAADLPHATSLSAAAGRPVDADDAARGLLVELDRWYDELLTDGPATLEACWKWRVGLLGRSVLVECADGSVRRGRLADLTFDGVSLETPDGLGQRLPPEAVRHLSAQELRVES